MASILYYMEPMVEADYPYMKYVNITSQLQLHMKALASSFDVSIICANHIKARLQREDFFVKKIYGVDHVALKKEHQHSVVYNKKIRDNLLSEAEKNKLKEIFFKEVPEDYKPDVIFTFLSYGNILREVYPDALLIHMEYGIFSRTPFPKTYHLDPFGILKDGYTNRMELDALAEIDEDDEQLAQCVKSLKKHLPALPAHVVKKINNFKSTVLLPLQFSNYHAFDLCSDFESQYAYLLKVLEDIPEDIGVLVTQHPGWPPVINRKTEGYLREFKNFIFDNSFNEIANMSQIALGHVNGVVSVSSSIGLQSMLYDLPVYIYGESHLSFLSEEKLEDFIQKVTKKETVNRNKVLSHLMKYYYIPDDFLQDPLFIKDYIYRLLNNREKMPLIESTKYLSNLYLSNNLA